MDTIILEKSNLDLQDSSFIKTVVQEVIDKIPTNLRLKNPTVRRKLFEQYGKEAFLDPIRHRYPIIDPDKQSISESTTLDCGLLLKAFYELNGEDSSESKKLANKAKELIKSTSCINNICVHLEGLEEIIELDTILHYFFDESI